MPFFVAAVFFVFLSCDWDNVGWMEWWMLEPSGKSAGFAVRLPCHASPEGAHYDVSCVFVFLKSHVFLWSCVFRNIVFLKSLALRITISGLRQMFNSSKRWLVISPSFTLQPTENMKFVHCHWDSSPLFCTATLFVCISNRRCPQQHLFFSLPASSVFFGNTVVTLSSWEEKNTILHFPVYASFSGVVFQHYFPFFLGKLIWMCLCLWK